MNIAEILKQSVVESTQALMKSHGVDLALPLWPLWPMGIYLRRVSPIPNQ